MIFLPSPKSLITAKPFLIGTKWNAAAEFLDLNFRHEHSGYGDLQTGLQEQILKLV